MRQLAKPSTVTAAATLRGALLLAAILVCACAGPRGASSTKPSAEQITLYRIATGAEAADDVGLLWDSHFDCERALAYFRERPRPERYHCFPHRINLSHAEGYGTGERVLWGGAGVSAGLTTVGLCFGTVVLAPWCAVAAAGLAGSAAINADAYDLFKSKNGGNHPASGDDEALRKNRAAAIGGDARAAYVLGRLLASAHDAEAWQWLCAAADAGETDAQIDLGHWHRADVDFVAGTGAFGTGLRRDNRVAYMWFRVAERHGAPRAKLALEFMSWRMSEDEVAAAEDLADAWQAGACRADVPGRSAAVAE